MRIRLRKAGRPALVGVLSVVATTTVIPMVAASAQPGRVGAPVPGQYAPVRADNAPLNLTVVLSPSSRSHLQALAKARTGTQQQRAAAVAKTAPSAGSRTEVRNALTAVGLHVTSETPWLIRVSATPAVAEQAFGVQLVGSGPSRHPDRPIVLPAALQGRVTTVIGLDQRPLVHPTVPASGPKAAAAPKASLVPRSVTAAPVGLTPTDLHDSYRVSPTLDQAGTGATVASVQLAGWNSTDLTTYAQHFGLGTPDVSQIALDGVDPAAATDGAIADAIAGDQEMLLAGAPKASQRIYFAMPDATGLYDSMDAIASDAATFNIAAVAVGWGQCEDMADWYYQQAVSDLLSRLLASGVTAFANSGDRGSTCSGPGVTGLAFPASQPAMISVGGTTLTPSPRNETAWSRSGGGESTISDRPSYQSSLLLTGTGRLVPDISAVADKATGPATFGTTFGWSQGRGTGTATSLMAGQFAATLADRGCPEGVGDVHSALYAAPSTAFNDITSGSNGLYSASAGYDEVTGLGTPNWSELGSVLVPTTSSCPLMIRTNFPQAVIPLGTKGNPTVGVPYSTTLVATGGVPGYGWSINAGSLPTGLSLSYSGLLSGTPTVTGPFSFTVQVDDASGNRKTRDYFLYVDPLTGRFFPLATTRIFSRTVGITPVTVPLAAYLPTNATAVVVNAQVFNPSASGYLRVTAQGPDDQAVASQEFVKGQTISNLVTVPVNTDTRAAQVKVSAGSAQVFMDIAGYYADDRGSVFTPSTPTRVFDQAVGTTTVRIPLGDKVPVGTTAAVMNVEVFNPSAAGYVRITPFGKDAQVATQEFNKGQAISNLVVVQLSGGSAQVKLSAGSGQVLIDLAGYFGSEPASRFTPLKIHRAFSGQVGTQPTVVDLKPGAVPSWATAAVVNVEVFNPSAAGYLRVTPAGIDRSVATQEFVKGQTISNLVMVMVVAGKLQLKLSAGSALVLVDVAGYFD